MSREYKQNPFHQNYYEFWHLKKTVKADINNAHKKYLHQIKTELKNNSSKLWSHIRSRKNTFTVPNSMSYNEDNLNQLTMTLNAFADFFSKSFVVGSDKCAHCTDKSLQIQ